MLVWACRSDDITSRTTEYGMQFSSLSYRLKPVSCSLVACYSAHAIFGPRFRFWLSTSRLFMTVPPMASTHWTLGDMAFGINKAPREIHCYEYLEAKINVTVALLVVLWKGINMEYFDKME